MTDKASARSDACCTILGAHVNPLYMRGGSGSWPWAQELGRITVGRMLFSWQLAVLRLADDPPGAATSVERTLELAEECARYG